MNAVTDRLAITYNLMTVLRMTVILKRKWIVHEEIKDGVVLFSHYFNGSFFFTPFMRNIWDNSTSSLHFTRDSVCLSLDVIQTI